MQERILSRCFFPSSQRNNPERPGSPISPEGPARARSRIGVGAPRPPNGPPSRADGSFRPTLRPRRVSLSMASPNYRKNIITSLHHCIISSARGLARCRSASPPRRHRTNSLAPWLPPARAAGPFRRDRCLPKLASGALEVNEPIAFPKTEGPPVGRVFSPAASWTPSRWGFPSPVCLANGVLGVGLPRELFRKALHGTSMFNRWHEDSAVTTAYVS